MNLVKVSRARNFCNIFLVNGKSFSTAQVQEQKESAKKTSLYDFHVARGGKIVDFAGYLLPVQYADQGLVQSHIHTRTHASVFDVNNKRRWGIYLRLTLPNNSRFLICCKLT